MIDPSTAIKLIETEICPRCKHVAIKWEFKLYIGATWLSCFECGMLASWNEYDLEWESHEVYTAFTDYYGFAALDLYLQPYS